MVWGGVLSCTVLFCKDFVTRRIVLPGVVLLCDARSGNARVLMKFCMVMWRGVMRGRVS